MSVFKPTGSKVWYYSFHVRGNRFSGSTGCTAKRDAETVEAGKRQSARVEVAQAAKRRAGPLTLDLACQRYWTEVGQHQKRPDQVEWSLAWLCEALGPETRLDAIGNDDVARIVAKRRGEPATGKGAKLVSNATVNRSVTEPLRKVIRRATDVWEVPTRPIAWKNHILKEPPERVRELSPGEEMRLFAALPGKYHALTRAGLMLALRETNLVELEWRQVDFGARQITVRAKGDRVHTVPLTPAVRELLWAQRGRHETRVWTQEPDRFGPGRPMTVAAFVSAFKRACRAARIADFHVHDLRHTAATRMLRSTGNLVHAQKLLGHSEIGTTVRYAHVTQDDLRGAMEATENVKESVKVDLVSAKSSMKSRVK